MELIVNLLDLIFFYLEHRVVEYQPAQQLAALYSLLGLQVHFFLGVDLLDSAGLNGEDDVQSEQEVAELAELDHIVFVLVAVEEGFLYALLADGAIT